MTDVAMHVPRARAAAALLRRRGDDLRWCSIDLRSALIEGAHAAGTFVDLTPVQTIADVAALLATFAHDLGRRADAFVDADLAFGRTIAECPQALVDAVASGRLPVTPSRAFGFVVDNWDEIAGTDGLADIDDLLAFAARSSDPTAPAAARVWQTVLFDAVEVAGERRRFRPGADGLDGRADGRLSGRDLAAFSATHRSIDAWWVEQRRRRSALLPVALSGEEALALLRAAWPSIAGPDGAAKWGDLEQARHRSGDPALRAAVDVLRGPLFRAIDAAPGPDGRSDGTIHIDDLTAVGARLGAKDVDSFMHRTGIEPPVLRVADPWAHVEETTTVMIRVGAKGAVIQAGGTLGFRVHRVVDGTFIVERVDATGIGIVAGVGVGATVHWDGERFGVAAVAEIGALAAATSTRSWLVDDADEVQTLIVSQAIGTVPGADAARGIVDSTASLAGSALPRGVEDALESGLRNVPLVGGLLGSAYGGVERYGRYHEPPPTRVARSSGIETYAAASGRVLGIDGWIEGTLAASTTTTVHADGLASTTRSVNGLLGAGVLAGVEGTGPLASARQRTYGSVSVERFVAPDGSPVRVELTIQYQLEGRLRRHVVHYDGALAASREAGEAVAAAAAMGSAAAVALDARRLLAAARTTRGVTVEQSDFTVTGSDYGISLTGELGAVLGIDFRVATASIRPAR